MNKVYIIAEAGVNHNGKMDLAYKLVDEAVKANVNAIKFQTFKAENLVTQDAKKADYQNQSVPGFETQYKMLKNLELSYEDQVKLKYYCDQNQIDFLSSPFDFESIDFLKKLNLKFWKIPSGDRKSVV